MPKTCQDCAAELETADEIEWGTCVSCQGHQFDGCPCCSDNYYDFGEDE